LESNLFVYINKHCTLGKKGGQAGNVYGRTSII